MDMKQFPQPEEEEVSAQEASGLSPEPSDLSFSPGEGASAEPPFFVPEMISEPQEETAAPRESPMPPDGPMAEDPPAPGADIPWESAVPDPPPLEIPPEEAYAAVPEEESLFQEEAAVPQESAGFMSPIPDGEEDLPEPSLPEEEPLLREEAAVPQESAGFTSPIPDGGEDLPEPSLPEEEPLLREEAAAPQDSADFMSRIPDVGEDLPDSSLLEVPHTGRELTPDDPAMDDQGMLGHGEAEPPFDPALLQDPALDEQPEQPQEDDSDQEYRDNGKEFDAMFGAAPASSEIPSHSRPPRKGRPKRKKGEGLFGIPNILVTFVWMALILAIGVTAGRMLWVCAAEVLAFGKEDQVVTVTIYESDTMDDITNKLYDAGLIQYKSLFQLYASISNAEEDIQPGIYDLNTRYDYHALVNFMTPRSSREVIELTIPEGYTCRQIFALLEENRICTVQDISAYAASGELEDYWFLEDVQRGDGYCLEGFLFPDTYEFYRNSTPKEALEKMLDNFDYRFSEEMRTQIDSLNDHLSDLMRDNGRSEDYISQNLFTVREVTIVASMIEKETSSSEESPTIASVIYNRLFNWGDTPAYLNIDASIVYALDGKTTLTTEDLQVDSPYNTYTNTGLTPTPISNPGLASLEAALNPATTDYYFYVLNPSTGSHQFSTTQDEHEAWRAQFAAERVG